MFSQILVVCVGNICRSPIGQALLQSKLGHLTVDSAGIQALAGKPADSHAKKIAEQHELNLQHHRGKQLDLTLCSKSDLILTMEKSHIDAVTEISPSARGKTMLLGHWIDKEIPDPYRKSEEMFAHVFNLIQEASLAWVKKLQP